MPVFPEAAQASWGLHEAGGAANRTARRAWGRGTLRTAAPTKARIMTDPKHSAASDDDCTALRARIETLEIRSTPQEVALEELTRTLLAQEHPVREQAEALRRLEAQLRAATPAPLARREEEGPPPHY